MEYETYETEAIYDDMYEEGTKGKVWFPPWFPNRFPSYYPYCRKSKWSNSILFLQVKVDRREPVHYGESKADRENWVKSFIFFFDSLLEEKASIDAWSDINPVTCECAPPHHLPNLHTR